MTKLLATTLLLLTLLVSPLMAEVIIGSFKCKAVNVLFPSVNEGKSFISVKTEYGMEKGSIIVFNYYYDKGLSQITFDEVSTQLDEEQSQSGFLKTPYKSLRENYFTSDDNIFLSRDAISVRFSYGGHLNLTRYYKDDWQGIYSRHYLNALLVISLDCRHPKQGMSDILDALKNED